MVTASYQEKRFEEEVNRTNGYADMQYQIDLMKSNLISSFAGIQGNMISTKEQVSVTNSMTTSYASYTPTNDGVPPDATHVLCYTSVTADGGDREGFIVKVFVEGGDGPQEVARAQGHKEEDGPEGAASNSFILKLIPAGIEGQGGFFRYKKTVSHTDGGAGSTASMIVRGYITPTSNELVFATPFDI